MKISLFQFNPIVGDIQKNTDKILELVKNCDSKIIVFPEMSIVGYPVEDLAFRLDFIDTAQKGVEKLSLKLKEADSGDKYVIVGGPSQNQELKTNSDFFKSDDISKSKLPKPYNSAYILHNGEIIDIYHKKCLPNYGVFDDFRIWTAGDKDVIFEVDKKRIAVIICEDIWQNSTYKQLAKYNIDATICINASVYEIGKPNLRYKVVSEFAKKTGKPTFYVNLVGSQDGLVFEGGSFAILEKDNKLFKIEADKFVEQELITDLELSNSKEFENHRLSKEQEMEETYNALVIGLKDYITKSGFKKVILGVSGGIDSALCAKIAVDALGSKNVWAIKMPSKFSSKHSIKDADDLIENLKIENFDQIDIQPFVDLFANTLKVEGLSYENLQARVRGLVLMTLSNKLNALCLATGNKSELAIGYSTIFGDAVGAYAPICDLTKTMVRKMCKFINSNKEIIPNNTIVKPPSAELREGQIDEDTLGKYEVLDEFIENFIELRKIPKNSYEIDLANKINSNEYKRRLYPLGTKVTKLGFNKDRRFPIINKF